MAIQAAMRELCHDKQERKTHGLGLILKNPKVTRYKGSMLSKNFGIYAGKVVITRMTKKLILTSITQPPHFTTDEANLIACMNLVCYSLDPLTLKLA